MMTIFCLEKVYPHWKLLTLEKLINIQWIYCAIDYHHLHHLQTEKSGVIRQGHPTTISF